MNKVFPIRFAGVEVCYDEPFWKHFLWFSHYEWDETPYGFMIRLLGINFCFRLGKWEE